MIAAMRVFVRNILQYLLKLTEDRGPAAQAMRGTTNIWKREINLPPILTALASIGVFFTVLLFEVGLSWTKILALVLFLAVLYFSLLAYLRYQQPEILKDSESVMLLGFLLISAVLFMQLLKDWHAPLATPIAAFPMLVGLLLSKRLAFITALVLALFVGVLNNFSLEYFMVHFFGSMAGIFALAKIRNRSDIASAGLKVAGLNIIVVLIIHLFKLWPLRTLEGNIGWAAFSGFSSGLIVLGALPYLESFFSRTTNIKLLELADFNQPLLKRLMIESPGTYHHSLMMASLAEQAAEAIGANPLLARVAAYYHDVGKLVKPEYFIENQQALGNPHDPLSPNMSSLIVMSHVKEGSALARQYGVDKVIIDCIEQHHGTSLIHYFYHRALEKNSETDEASFRYPGPRPRTREAAILMLADSIEAASRSIEEPTPARFQDMVEKIVNNKFTDGQFGECPITLHDLNRLSESMVNTLSGIYHARIEYKGEGISDK